MSVALGIAVALLALGVASGTALVYVGRGRRLGRRAHRLSPQRRRRGAMAGGIAAIALAAVAGLAIAAPWGRNGLLYAVAAYGAFSLTVVLTGALLQAQQETRRRRG